MNYKSSVNTDCGLVNNIHSPSKSQSNEKPFQCLNSIRKLVRQLHQLREEVQALRIKVRGLREEQKSKNGENNVSVALATLFSRYIICTNTLVETLIFIGSSVELMVK